MWVVNVFAEGWGEGEKEPQRVKGERGLFIMAGKNDYGLLMPTRTVQ